MQVYDDDGFHGGQRSSEVKCGKLCAMVAKLGQMFVFLKTNSCLLFISSRGHNWVRFDHMP